MTSGGNGRACSCPFLPQLIHFSLMPHCWNATSLGPSTHLHLQWHTTLSNARWILSFQQLIDKRPEQRCAGHVTCYKVKPNIVYRGLDRLVATWMMCGPTARRAPSESLPPPYLRGKWLPATCWLRVMYRFQVRVPTAS